MIIVKQTDNNIAVSDNGQVIKKISVAEFKHMDIDNMLDTVIPRYSVSSRGDECLEHASKRLYLKIKLTKLQNKLNISDNE